MNKVNYEEALSLKLFTVIMRAHNSLLEIDKRDIRRYGLNQTEFGVLELLYHKGSMPLQQIGEKILITSGSITYVINKLENKELISREVCMEDRRITYAALTEKGTALLSRIFPEHARALEKALGGLTSEEKKIAIDLMKKVGVYAQKEM